MGEISGISGRKKETDFILLMMQPLNVIEMQKAICDLELNGSYPSEWFEILYRHTKISGISNVSPSLVKSFFHYKFRPANH